MCLVNASKKGSLLSHQFADYKVVSKNVRWVLGFLSTYFVPNEIRVRNSQSELYSYAPPLFADKIENAGFHAYLLPIAVVWYCAC